MKLFELLLPFLVLTTLLLLLLPAVASSFCWRGVPAAGPPPPPPVRCWRRRQHRLWATTAGIIADPTPPPPEEEERAEEEQPPYYETTLERHNARWMAMYERLKTYKEKHGDCRVPKHYEDDPALGKWVDNERNRATLDDSIGKDRREKLNSLRFQWSSETLVSPIWEKRWNFMFDKLQAYKRSHGDCLVPKRYVTEVDNEKLGNWVTYQRSRHAAGRLRKDRIVQLESVGFVWCLDKQHSPGGTRVFSLQEQQWNENYSRLQKFLDQHGHCRVPEHYVDDPVLAHWVKRQRDFYRDGKIVRNHIQRLELLGFEWTCRDALVEEGWEQMFAQLREFHKQHGHCSVPGTWKEDLALADWVSRQRRKKNSLRKERKDLLETLGFAWSTDDAYDARWQATFEKLKAFHKSHGQFPGPSTNKKLYDWARRQRNQHRQGKLSDSRKNQLQDIGVDLAPRAKSGKRK